MSFLSEIKKFDKSQLKETETVVRTLVSVQVATGSGGSFSKEEIVEHYDLPSEFRKKVLISPSFLTTRFPK